MERPNMAVLVLDSFRYDHLWRSVCGEPLCPRLSDFAEGATSFENAIAPAAFTGPTHVSMFTGALPVRPAAFTLARLTGGRLPEPNLIRLLREAGYLCCAFSANPWVSRSTALGRDFDVLISSAALTGPAAAHFEESLPQKLRRRGAVLLRSLLPRPAREAPTSQVRALLAQTELLAASVPTVLRALRSRWPDRPVFAFVNLMVTHDPYLFEARDAEFARPQDAGRRGIVPRAFQPDFWLDLLGVRPIGPELLRRIRWSYAAAARHADRLAGRIIESLDRCLGREDTDVAVTADHGELLGEHGSFDHGVFLYEPVVHVPLIVRSAALPAGRRVERGVQSHWLWSLLVERAGAAGAAEVPEGQGSLAAAAAGAEAEEGPLRSFAHPETEEMSRLRAALLSAASQGVDSERVALRPLEGHTQAVRVGRRALVCAAGGGRRAFSIGQDGAERELNGAEMEEARAALEPLLLDVEQQAPGEQAPEEPTPAQPHADVLRRLRRLGYTD